MYFHTFHSFWGLLLAVTLILIASVPSSVTSPAISAGNTGNGLGSPKQTPKQRRKYSEKCKAGKIYNVTSVEYLKDNYEDLQCMFWAAEEPTKVPVGPLYGDILTVGNQRFLNFVVRTFWSGKFIEKVKCQGSERFLGWNRVIGQPQVPFDPYLGYSRNNSNIHPMYRDNKRSLMIDYRQEMAKICPDFVQMTGRNFETVPVPPVRKSPVHLNFYPLNLFLDIVRLVGRQEDGGAILLGQLFLEDRFSSSKVAKPVSFFTVISYDPELNQEFVYGQTLKPLESDNHYKNQNLMDIFMALVPVTSIISEPIYSVKNIASEVVASGRSLGNYLWDACCASGGDSKRLTEEFKAYQLNVTSSSKKSTSKFISKHEDFHSHFKEL